MIRFLKRAAPIVLFGVLPVVFVAGQLGLDAHHLVDFRNLWHAGKDVLDGRSPYHASPNAASPVTSDCFLSGPDCFVYPPPAAFLVAPLSVLPFAVAGAIWFAVEVAALVLALRFLGVRDWRCYGLAVGSAPALSAIEGGTLTPVLVLGVALCWRYRSHAVIAAASLGCVIMLKIFLWPLLAWFVITRRVRTAVAGAAVVAAGTTACWALIGLAGLRGYPQLLHTLNDVWGPRAYTPAALGLAAGLPPRLATGTAVVSGLAALAIAARVAGRTEGERRAFAAVLAAALLLSPIVWLHYFTLLLVPLALVKPRLALPWALPLVFLVLPGMADGHADVIALGLALAATVSTVCITNRAGSFRASAAPAPAR